VGWVEPEESHCGYPGVLHGGLQSAFLDDVMYWAVASRTLTSSVTVELSCRFRSVAHLGQRFELVGTAGAPEGRKLRAEGALLAPNGTTIAEANALYLLHPREEFVRTMLPYFDFHGCSPGMVERFSRP
jgi:acyl-coenzyme A thioesterase PaaI-like protein